MDVPRYPPFARGLPAASVGRLLADQTDLIGRLRQIVQLTEAQFDQVVQPVIERFTAFVHLLPASEDHHHRGAGGLLRHSLEVAVFAAQGARGVPWDMDRMPEDRHRCAVGWTVAAALGGLLHDIGKPVSDVRVVDASGQKTWHPYQQSLLAWAEGNGISRYFLAWRPQRKDDHLIMTARVAWHIVPAGVDDWLDTMGPELVLALYDALAGRDRRGGPILRLVKEADSASTGADLKRMPQTLTAPGLSVPVAESLLRIMRVLVRNRVWVFNKIGQPLWHLAVEGEPPATYLIWNRAASDVAKYLREENMSGIPRDPDIMLETLIDHGVVQPEPSGQRKRAILLEGITHPLRMVRFQAAERITDIVPTVMPARAEGGPRPVPPAPPTVGRPGEPEAVDAGAKGVTAETAESLPEGQGGATEVVQDEAAAGPNTVTPPPIAPPPPAPKDGLGDCPICRCEREIRHGHCTVCGEPVAVKGGAAAGHVAASVDMVVPAAIQGLLRHMEDRPAETAAQIRQADGGLYLLYPGLLRDVWPGRDLGDVLRELEETKVLMRGAAGNVWTVQGERCLRLAEPFVSLLAPLVAGLQEAVEKAMLLRKVERYVLDLWREHGGQPGVPLRVKEDDFDRGMREQGVTPGQRHNILQRSARAAVTRDGADLVITVKGETDGESD